MQQTIRLLIILMLGSAAYACEETHKIPPRAETATAFQELPAAQQPINFTDIDYALLGEAILHEANLRRAEHDLPPLGYLPELEQAACMHVQDMITLNFFAHENPHVPEHATPLDRVQLLGLEPRFVAENITQAFGIQYTEGEAIYPRKENGETILASEPGGEPIPPHTYLSFAQATLDGWMASPGHRENILSEHPTHLGAACEYTEEGKMNMPYFYCGQVFFTPMNTP